MGSAAYTGSIKIAYKSGRLDNIGITASDVNNAYVLNPSGGQSFQLSSTDGAAAIVDITLVADY